MKNLTKILLPLLLSLVNFSLSLSLLARLLFFPLIFREQHIGSYNPQSMKKSKNPAISFTFSRKFPTFTFSLNQTSFLSPFPRRRAYQLLQLTNHIWNQWKFIENPASTFTFYSKFPNFTFSFSQTPFLPPSPQRGAYWFPKPTNKQFKCLLPVSLSLFILLLIFACICFNQKLLRHSPSRCIF